VLSHFGGYSDKTQKLFPRLLMLPHWLRGLNPMKTVIKPLMLGILLLSVPACRTSNPPATDICIGDGHGGADCTLSSGVHQYKTPSELNNSWIIPDQTQAANFVSWCYDISPNDATFAMNLLRKRLNQ
jgi:hypothetical protein